MDMHVVGCEVLDRLLQTPPLKLFICKGDNHRYYLEEDIRNNNLVIGCKSFCDSLINDEIGEPHSEFLKVYKLIYLDVTDID